MSKLNVLLANIAVFNQKVYNMHWNLVGESFMPYHKLTEKTFEQFVELYDEIAEKLVMMGKTPFSTLKAYLENSEIEEIEPKKFRVEEVSQNIVKDLNTIEKIALEVEGVHNVQPLLDEVFMAIDKHRWFYTASLGK